MYKLVTSYHEGSGQFKETVR